MKASRPVPLCRKCDQRHYNVQSCRDHAAKVKYEEEHQVFPRWRSDGLRRFGDNLPSFNRQGNTFWRKRDLDE